MFNANADPLAMHIVASSALNLLRELSNIDGVRFVARVYQSALYDAAVKRLSGEETGLPDHPVVSGWVEGIAEAIKSGGVKGPNDITINDEKKSRSKHLSIWLIPSIS